MTFTRRIGPAVLALTVALGLGACASNNAKQDSKQESAGEYFDDSTVTSKVKLAIFHEPSLKSSEISVETYKGVVQLSGFVTSQAAINKAVEVARRVSGVKAVRNDMRLK